MIAFQWLATLCAGLFAGAALYISLVEHPARLSCNVSVALAQFAPSYRPSYRKASWLQASLAGLGLISAVIVWLKSASLLWLAGGLTLGAVIPYTLIAVFPTNKRLLDPTLDPATSLALALLRQWGRLHRVRSVLGLLAFMLFIVLYGCAGWIIPFLILAKLALSGDKTHDAKMARRV